MTPPEEVCRNCGNPIEGSRFTAGAYFHRKSGNMRCDGLPYGSNKDDDTAPCAEPQPAAAEPIDPKDTHGLIVKWHDDDQLFVASILEMGWCTGHGSTREEAIAMAEDNMREALCDPDIAKLSPCPHE